MRKYSEMFFVLFRILAVIAAISLPSGLARAQAPEKDWDATALRAEEAIRNAKASNAALEDLRAEIAEQRAAARAILDRGSIEVQTLQVRLDALGPAPGKDQAEPAHLAQRRADLSDRLAVAGEPLLQARQSFNRAEVLINEIDRLIRSRQRAELFEHAPSPILPTRWVSAAGDVAAYVSKVSSDLQAVWTSPGQGLIARQRAPVAIALAAAGIFILGFVGPQINRRLELRANAGKGRTGGRSSFAFLAASRLLLPAIGAFLVLLAIVLPGLGSTSTRALRSGLASAPMFLILGNWLGQLLFAPTMPERRLLRLDDRTAKRGLRLAFGLSAVLAAEALLEAAELDFAFQPPTRSFLAMIVVFTGAWLLFRFSNLFKQNGVAANGGTVDGASFTPLLRRLIQAAAIAAVVCVATGYVQLARQAMIPMILSLGMVGLGIVLHRLLSALANPLHDAVGLSGSASTALIPYALGLLVTLFLLPLAAIIWGARVTDLSELWILFAQGVEINGTRISIGTVAALATVFVVGLFLTRTLQRFLGTAILPKTQIDGGGQSAIITGVGYSGVLLSAVAAVAAAGLDLSNLAIIAGALSVGLGFGLQAVVANFVSGIILLVERPVKEGDWIEVSGHSGIVRKIAVRSTRIETFDRHSVIVPNADLITGVVKNMTLGSTEGRLVLPVSISHVGDVEAAKAIILDVAAKSPLVTDDPGPSVLFTGLGTNALNFELRCILSDIYAQTAARSDMLLEIYRRLGSAGIEVPNLSKPAQQIEPAKPAAKPAKA